MLVKCFWCKEKSEKEIMLCDERSTGKFNKNGTEKMIRKYFHHNCYELFLEDKRFKEKEFQELTDLYDYLLELHGIDNLDGRMLEKIQDFRNGTVKVNNKKYKKYKEGTDYKTMLETYKHIRKRIDYVLQTKQFQKKWNEFSYIFGMMVNNVNDIKQISKINDQMTVPKKVKSHDIDLKITKSTRKKDELDISEFL